MYGVSASSDNQPQIWDTTINVQSIPQATPVVWAKDVFTFVNNITVHSEPRIIGVQVSSDNVLGAIIQYQCADRHDPSSLTDA